MDYVQFATISSAIKASYPSANLMPDDQSKSVWYTMLADLDYDTCLNALKIHISTNKYPPTIADLREKCSLVSEGEIDDWGKGWKQLEDAIRFKGMYREDEAYEEMDEITQQVVKRLGYKNLCVSENVTADRANFRMIYEQIQERKKKMDVLPKNLQVQLEQSKKAQIGVGENESMLHMRKRDCKI
ncbi:replicative helicase loader/inhibitor [Anaerosacchariphilus polymeriproducens]|uniref:Uncharacterized protein n=1 Tax=Anaerosacchariphilus polymeriproducens TaxID=1812858 RepID=A0A371AZQ1_9FIRM|nr:replicative helicase loader/inhibitor [Anaerosacchariphilus polymeriproducens]RDU25041.1 hypothetical protein DWV06_01235 [Anaerosacchariphilus polymeriproducens]